MIPAIEARIIDTARELVGRRPHAKDWHTGELRRLLFELDQRDMIMAAHRDGTRCRQCDAPLGDRNGGVRVARGRRAAAIGVAEGSWVCGNCDGVAAQRIEAGHA